MKNFASLLVVLLLINTSAGFASLGSAVPKQKVRTLVNLLGYIGKDYSNAVQASKIINELEYKEMVDFSRRIASLYEQLRKKINRPDFTGLAGKISKLQRVIKEKGGANKVAQITSSIREQLLKLGLVKVTPQQWPNLAKGKKIYTKYCQSCHGANGFGNGPLAAQLNPPPTNFRDSSNTDQLSPLQAYNTIRLGLKGTAMRAFSGLSDQEVWAVAFYVNSLNYKTQVPDSVRTKIINALADTASLRSISLYTNQQWKQILKSKKIDTKSGMAVVRDLTANPGSDESSSTLAKALTLLEKSQKAYASEDYSQASSYALKAYLNGVEPVESQIRAINRELVKKVESAMLAVRSAIQNRVGEKQFEAKIQSAALMIQEAQELLSNRNYSFWINFLLAASILLREGLEAFLIIMVILSVLRSMGAGRTVKYVHGGWIVALLTGVLGWFLVQSLIEFSSMQRELMEAIGAGIAVALLLYIGFWMHSKSQAAQWKKFIKEKVHGMLNKESMWGLAFLSFVVVFREAFESIIFLSSISFKSGGSNAGIFAALLAVALIIAGIGYAFTRMSRKIPVRQVFRYSSLMLAVLAVILIGKGVRSLQEAGYIDIASLPFNWNLPTLGFYATWPTMLAQLAVLSVIVGLWYYSNHLARRLERA